jgi:diadenosine tetraphosphatase ApaH/serine/threonine PP2A family protein phosphatase
MRIAIISDVHSNLAALEATLHNIASLRTDAICCLGDIVGYGPFPNECVALVRKNCTAVVKGNHDSGLLGQTPPTDFNTLGQRALTWAAGVIEPDHLEFLRGLPMLTTVGPVSLVHASPANPGSWTYVLTMDQARDAFRALTTDVCCIGHTHVPVVIGEDLSINTFRNPHRTPSDKCRFLINVGSVGQPRDGDPRAAFGLLDTKSWTYELIRVDYDVEGTAAAILNAGLPEALARRLYRGV